jgi:predicted dehydrogenase
MTQKQIKIAIVGTGTIAREHAQALKELPNRASLFAAADLDKDCLSEFTQKYGIAVSSTDPHKVITHPDVDLVVVATPPVNHEETVFAALEAKKYVLCEKPLAANLHAADKIIKKANHYQNRLTVGYQLRYGDAIRRLTWLCNHGHLGELKYGCIQRHGTIPMRHAAGESWWGNWAVAGGGVVITQLIHELDLLLQIFGEPDSVSAIMATRFTAIESEDDVSGKIVFKNGAMVTVKASLNSGLLDGCFQVVGDDGQIQLPWDFSTSHPDRASQSVKQLNKALPDTKPPSSSMASRIVNKIARKLALKKEHEAISAHQRYYTTLFDAIENGLSMPVSPEEARQSLELCAGLYESAITGKTVQFPLSDGSAVYGGITPHQYSIRSNTEQPVAVSAYDSVSANASTPSILSSKSKKVVSTQPLKVGLLGLDTSHAPTFTQILNDPRNPQHIPGATVVAGYPGGSSDMEISISRVKGFTDELRDKHGVEILDDPLRVAEKADLIFITAADGRTHRELFEAVCQLGKPTFIDKPMATSSVDAQTILKKATENDCRMLGTSAFRYADPFVSAVSEIHQAGEQILDCEVHGWLPIEPTQGRFFWYGIHTVEMLVGLMGPGAVKVDCLSFPRHDEIEVTWTDGRTGTVFGHQDGGQSFWLLVKTDQRIRKIDVTPSLPTLAPRLLSAVLDVLTNNNTPRIWRASAAGTPAGSRPGRLLDPHATDTLDVIRILEAAGKSYESGSTCELSDRLVLAAA